MIDKKFLICTECIKDRKKKPRRFKSLRNLNIHITKKHAKNYKVRLEKGSMAILRTKRPHPKSNVWI